LSPVVLLACLTTCVSLFLCLTERFPLPGGENTVFYRSTVTCCRPWLVSDLDLRHLRMWRIEGELKRSPVEHRCLWTKQSQRRCYRLVGASFSLRNSPTRRTRLLPMSGPHRRLRRGEDGAIWKGRGEEGDWGQYLRSVSAVSGSLDCCYGGWVKGSDLFHPLLKKGCRAV